LYCTTDRGATSMRMTNGIPPVSVHDVIIQSREHDLVIGTHGRSIYVVNIAALEQLDANKMQKFYVYDPGTVKIEKVFEMSDEGEYDLFNKASVPFTWYVENAGTIKVEVRTAIDNVLISEYTDSSKRGLNIFPVSIYVDSANAVSYQAWLDKHDAKGEPQPYGHGKTLPLAGEFTVTFTYKPNVGDGSTAERKLVLVNGRNPAPQIPEREREIQKD
jgi:hypothetical protein